MREYEMSFEQLDVLLDASKPAACMTIGSYAPRSPQQNANIAWSKLGREMGFDSLTVEPVVGKGNRFFTANPKVGT